MNGNAETMARSGTFPLSSAYDSDACDLLKDARAVYHHIALEVLQRWATAEHQLDVSGQSALPSLVVVPLYLERAFNDQFRSCNQPRYPRCVDVNPMSSDVLDGRWR